MNQPGIRTSICFTSSAALHAAAVGLLVWTAGSVLPQLSVQDGGQVGFVASISSTATEGHSLPPLDETQSLVDVLIVEPVTVLPESLNPAARQLNAFELPSTQVSPPREVQRPKGRDVSFGTHVERPGDKDLARQTSELDSSPPSTNGSVSSQPADTGDSIQPPRESAVTKDVPKVIPAKSATLEFETGSQPPAQPQAQTPAKQVVEPTHKPTHKPKLQEPVKQPRQPRDVPAPTTPQPVAEPSKGADSQLDSKAGDLAKADRSGFQIDEQPQKLAGNVAPQYPADAYRNGQEGVVYLLVDIDAVGSVSNAKVHRTSGFESLDVAARQAVLQWMFRPGILNKTHVACQALVPVRFRIE